MPKIPPQVINSVFYLYNSREDAEAGKPFGGTGFFVAFNTEIPDFYVPYAVTNWHLAVRGGASVIRVNKIGGGVDIFEFDPSEWIFAPSGYDVAIVSVPLNSEIHDVVVLNVEMLLSENDIDYLEIGPGEDVFMVGRFVDHDGAETNVPAVRFGHVSVMPQRVRQPTGSDRPSFILDVHSRTGFSGSPVFVYRSVGSNLTNSMLSVSRSVQFLKLLAIHWDQFPEYWEIKKGATKTAEGVVLSDDAQYIKGMSGMTLAAPAWAIKELLDMPAQKTRRDLAISREKERRFIEKSVHLEGEAAMRVAPESDNFDHKEDFTRLLNAASRKPPQGD